MSKLEELRQIVADAFAEAAEQQDIERLAKINVAIDGVSQEQDALIAKNADLLKSYKDLVQHTSFGTDRAKVIDEVSPQPVSFEDALKEFLANKK